MDTRNFNFIDSLVAKLRLGEVNRFIERGDEILDFGCGSQGYLLRMVSNKIKSGVGIDYDVEIKDENNLKFSSYNFKNKLPFNDNSFNKVVMLAVLEHIDLNRVEILFKEFRRVLKKDGLVVLTTPTPRSKPILELLAYKFHIISEGEIRDHKKYYDKNNMVELANNSNLSLENYKLFQFGINSVAIFKKN